MAQQPQDIAGRMGRLSLESGQGQQAQQQPQGGRERGPPALRAKRSQRFTVNANPASAQSADAPLVPTIPTLNPPPALALDRHTSISSYSHSSSVSASDTDSNPDYPSTGRSTLNPLAVPVQPFQSQSYHQSPGPTPPHTMSSGPYMTPPSSRGKPGTGVYLNTGRPGLPGQWMDQGPQGMPGIVAPPEEDEIIPTAIVIKNIPFSVRREQLTAIIEDLMIPSPYAFNYHFDNGIFRGLAFANFRSPSEADAAVAGLNGFDIQGRKLRVEYKKVLQAGEKERIEKEKAIKRMRSMQMQKEQEQYGPGGGGVYLMRGREASWNGAEGPDDFGEPVPSSFSMVGCPNTVASPGPTTRNLAPPPSHQSPPSAVGVESVASGSPPERSRELDMNDPHTLEIYSRILLFKDDAMRDELAFARSLSASQRRIVHQVAKKLGLEHRSEGLGEDRHVVVLKGKPRPTTVGRTGGGFLTTPDHHSGLRGKKSMPDMRGGNGNGGGAGGYGEPPSRSLGRRSNANLRNGNATTGRKPSSGRGDAQPLFGSQPFQPAPALSTNSHEEGGTPIAYARSASPQPPVSPSPHPHNVVRQPKGPEGGSMGFGERMRSARLMPPVPAAGGEVAQTSATLDA